MNASTIVAVSKQLGLKGVFIKSFRNGQELRQYTMPNGDIYKIRAFSHDHT